MFDLRRSLEEMETLRNKNTALLETLLYENLRSNFLQHPNSGVPTGGGGKNTNSPPMSPFYYPVSSFGPPPQSSHHHYQYQQQMSQQQSVVMMNPRSAYSINQEEREEARDSFSSADYVSSRFSRAGGGPSDHHSVSSKFVQPLQQHSTSSSLGSPGRGNLTAASSHSNNPSPSLSANQESSSQYGEEERDSFTNMSRQGILSRSVSERIGHKSELASQVQRNAWARHTTK